MNTIGPAPNYPICDVTHWPAVGDEMMGSKPKCWLVRPDDNVKWLFKEKHRLNSEDDWSEKIASELAGLMGLPHATVELAERNGQRGIITRDLVSEIGAEELIPGNSLLVEDDPLYPSELFYHVAQHTVERLFRVLANRSVGLPPGCNLSTEIIDARDLFIGYLLFDAWIGNTDRHHENWAVLKVGDGRHVLSPSFDHAASLGHNIQDAQRQERLTTRDGNRSLASFVVKARSAFYRTETDSKPVSTSEAFRLALAACRKAGTYWLDRLHKVDYEQTTDIVRRVPSAIMPDVAKQFAEGILRENRTRLLTIEA